MNAADAIAALDRQIAKHGEDIVLRRFGPNQSVLDRPCRAFVRGYKPNELAGGLQQGDSVLALSPTNMPVEFTGASGRLRVNDRIVVSGRVRNVQFVDPVRIDDVLVRLNVTVRG